MKNFVILFFGIPLLVFGWGAIFATPWDKDYLLCAVVAGIACMLAGVNLGQFFTLFVAIPFVGFVWGTILGSPVNLLWDVEKETWETYYVVCGAIAGIAGLLWRVIRPEDWESLTTFSFLKRGGDGGGGGGSGCGGCGGGGGGCGGGE